MLFFDDFHKRTFLQVLNGVGQNALVFLLQRIQMSVAPHATQKNTNNNDKISVIFLIKACPWNEQPKLNRGYCLMQIWWAFIVRTFLLAYWFADVFGVSKRWVIVNSVMFFFFWNAVNNGLVHTETKQMNTLATNRVALFIYVEA